VAFPSNRPRVSTNPRHLEHVVVYKFAEEHFGGYGRECEDPNEPRAGPLRRVVPTAVETPGSREPSHGSPIVWRPSLDVWRNSFGGRRDPEQLRIKDAHGSSAVL
jgi:hypothetical protein